MQFKIVSKWALDKHQAFISAKREPKIKYHLARSKGQTQTHLQSHANFPSLERQCDLGNGSIVWHFLQQRWCGPQTMRLGGLWKYNLSSLLI